MLIKTMEPFGAVLNLSITGKVEEVRREVFKLYNYGVISNIPSTYDEEKDTWTMVQSDKRRMDRGFRAIATIKVRNQLEKRKGLSAFKAKQGGVPRMKEAIDLHVQTMIAAFQPADRVYTDNTAYAAAVEASLDQWNGRALQHSSE